MKKPAPLLWIALAATAGLTIWSLRGGGEDSGLIEATAPRRTPSTTTRRAPAGPPVSAAAAANWQRAPMSSAETDLFGGGAPAPAAPTAAASAPSAPVVAEAPPPPPPPALRYLGQLTGVNDKPQVYLAYGEEYLIASPGETVAGRFRLDKMTAQFLEFTDLTTRKPLRVAVGEP